MQVMITLGLLANRQVGGPTCPAIVSAAFIKIFKIEYLSLTRIYLIVKPFPTIFRNTSVFGRSFSLSLFLSDLGK